MTQTSSSGTGLLAAVGSATSEPNIEPGVDENNTLVIDAIGDVNLFSMVSPTLRVGFKRILDALDALDHRIDHAATRFRKLDARVDAAGQYAVRIRVVPAVADLPAEAPPTEWYRVVATPAQVYVGNGAGRPLSKFTTTAL